jgi:hypothetical protein
MAPKTDPLDGARAKAIAHLSTYEKTLYAVLDAARDPAVLRLVRGAGSSFASLFEGDRAAILEPFAPYFARLDDPSLLKAVVDQGWGKSWGIFVTSSRRAPLVRQKLQEMMVASVDGALRELHFRFYDPRVLRPFLRAITPRQRASIFETIDGFLVEGDHPRTMLRFAAHEGSVQEHSVELLPEVSG